MANTLYTPEQMAAAILAVPGGYQILVTAPTGATVTAEKGGATYTGVRDSALEKYVIFVPGAGTYTVTVVYNGEAITRTAVITETEVTAMFEIPDEYTRLEYIESSGTQYIDTGIVLQNGFYAEFDASFSAYDSYVLGSMFSNAVSTFVFASNWQTETIGAGTNYAPNAAYNRPFDVKHHYEANDFFPGYGIEIDGTPITLSPQPGFSALYPPVSTFLFAINNNGTAAGLAQMKLYGEMKLWSDSGKENLVGDYFPVKRDNGDGTFAVGLYDMITNRLFTSEGTGEFIAGPEITL